MDIMATYGLPVSIRKMYVRWREAGDAVFNLSHLSGSDRRPTVYDTVALPAELRWHGYSWIEQDTGIEPVPQPWEACVLPLY